MFKMLFRCFESRFDQVDVGFWGCNAKFGFLLKTMQNVHPACQFHCVNRSESVAMVIFYHFQYAS